MKRFLSRVVVLLLLLGLSFVFVGSVSAADPTLYTLTANNLYARFINDSDHVLSFSLDAFASVAVYEDGDDDASFLGFSNFKGTIDESVPNAKFPRMEATVAEQNWDKKSGVETAMNIVTTNDDIFVRFTKASNKKAKNKWIEVPFENYQELGKALGVEDLFEFALSEDNTSDKFFEVSLALAKKHNLFYIDQNKINDNQTLKGATRFNLRYNNSSIAPYFRELAATLDEKTKEGTVLSINGFLEMLSNKSFVDYLANYSYVSLWFDDVTSLSSRIRDSIVMPNILGKNTSTVFTVDLTVSDPNKAFIPKVPAKFLTFEEALDVFKLDIDDFTIANQTPEEKDLKDSLKNYNKAKKKNDKSYYAYEVAIAYENLYQNENAAKYYKIAASNYKKNGVDYFEALAQAEWNLGNGAKAKDYFAKAYSKDPKAIFVLDQYGWFLLGITPTTAPHQDLSFALKLNEELVSKDVDDDTLLSLYLNYILQGNKIKAEETKARFDNFTTGENYNWIAHAYHRIGNKTESARYAKLATDAGYIRDKNDIQFFSISF